MADGKGDPEDFDVPEALSDSELKSLNALIHKLPIPHLDDLKEHQKDCCCCCCCCDKDDATGASARFDFNPSLTIYAIPFSGPRRAISRIEGTFSWNAPAGTASVTLEWERYNSTGLLIHGFQPLGPNYTGLPPSGFAAWDTRYTLSLGHRVHIRAITDQGVTSRVRWRDGNGGAGWL
ncbi:MAG: hypothetical protein HKN28_04135 [Alphaproteobacteria bacterium]|nr:hypothetical protein [Alphaproteobacteria bacterium]